jgi:hypothetical protein
VGEEAGCAEVGRGDGGSEVVSDFGLNVVSCWLMILSGLRLGRLTLEFYYRFVVEDIYSTSRIVTLKIMVTAEILCVKFWSD